MQAAVYRGKENIQVQEWPSPELADGEVLVRIRYAGICGTDMITYSGNHPRVTPPRVLGHELFGAIEEATPAAEPEWKKGIRVAVYPLISCRQCNPCREGNAHVCEKLSVVGIDTDGGFAEYAKVLPDQLVPVPDEVSDEQAALLEPLSVAVHTVGRSHFHVGNTALVTGGGPVGILIAQVLRAAGARKVAISEVKPFRRTLAERLGIPTFDPARENCREALRRLVEMPSVDHVFEATGSPQAYPDAVQACKVRGEITFVGIPKTPPEVDIQSIIFKEIRTSSSRVYAVRDFYGAIALLARHAVDVLPMITDRLNLDEAPQAFLKMLRAEESLKILLAP
jgi:(R,R)-butanediol dehydrogenase/meso-butanediol dehydrogenase/diacetyl reductase